jgi:hypothetical protein
MAWLPGQVLPVLLRKSKDKRYQLVGPMGALLKLPSQGCVQVQVTVKITSWGHVTNSFLRILASSLDTSSPHPRGGKYRGRRW